MVLNCNALKYGLPRATWEPEKSVSSAVAQSTSHVRSGFWRAIYYINRGDGRHAYDTLGWVLHTLQDSTSPAHKYFKIWRGYATGTPGWWEHVHREAFMYQARRSTVYRATRWVWHMYYYHLIPNSGQIFMF